MATQIVPTILAHTPAEYAAQLALVRPFAHRLHVDITDGDFAEPRTVGLGQVYGAGRRSRLELHLMVRRPQDALETAIALHPELVIIHAEAEGDHAAALAELRRMGVRAGLAVLPDTSIDSVRDLLPAADHLLIFTGSRLGAHSREFLPETLAKIPAARAVNPALEISVDGSVSLANAAQAAAAGADVLNIGGAIRSAPDPAAAYYALVAAANQ